MSEQAFEALQESENRDHYYEGVKEFQTAFSHPVAEKPTPMTLERATSRAIWTAEEIAVEFLHQSSTNQTEFLEAMEKFKAGLDKAIEKSLKDEFPKNDVERSVGQGDALTDGMWFIFGSFVEKGLLPKPMFDIVYNSNMAKLGADGKPILRESDGKIMKPEGWMPPEPQLEAEVRRQIELAN